MRLYDVNEVAEILHCSRASVFNYVNANVLPKGTKIGGKRLWRDEDLLKAFENGEEKKEEKRNDRKKKK